MWNPNEYLKFAGERARPFFDLLAQVAKPDAATIADLGCGPGTLTRTLIDRWPTARVIGVDNSREMLERAQQYAIPDRLEFVEVDIGQWSPDAPLDLIVSNAALQWLGDHEALLARIAAMLKPGGMLAVQIPSRFNAPSQQAIDATSADPRWASRLAGIGLHRDCVMPIAWYVDRLHDLGFTVNAWETTYIHVLSGDDPVLQWMRGTALRPLLSRLEPHEIPEFEKQLAARFAAAYPSRNGKTLFPFPRLFFVASRQ
jgi:trans-aconitate 2-methyltransferase